MDTRNPTTKETITEAPTEAPQAQSLREMLAATPGGMPEDRVVAIGMDQQNHWP